jgi:hypothetical protein
MVQTLLSQYPAGLPGSKLPKLFREQFGKELEYKRLGFEKLTEYMRTVDGVEVFPNPAGEGPNIFKLGQVCTAAGTAVEMAVTAPASPSAVAAATTSSERRKRKRRRFASSKAESSVTEDVPGHDADREADSTGEDSADESVVSDVGSMASDPGSMASDDTGSVEDGEGDGADGLGITHLGGVFDITRKMAREEGRELEEWEELCVLLKERCVKLGVVKRVELRASMETRVSDWREGGISK